jgi:membrane fusion protein (multidrug efflux system)
MPGAFVRAVVGNAVRENAILAPQRGVTRDPKGNATALVLGDDGVVQSRAITVSQTVGDQWLVEAGLVAGDHLIVEGLQKVKPGTQARAAAPGALSTAAGK